MKANQFHQITTHQHTTVLSKEICYSVVLTQQNLLARLLMFSRLQTTYYFQTNFGVLYGIKSKSLSRFICGVYFFIHQQERNLVSERQEQAAQ